MAKNTEINAKKSAFVVAINAINSTRISKKMMQEQADKLELNIQSATRAYMNVTSSAVPLIDRRTRDRGGDKKFTVSLSEKTRENYRKLSQIKTRALTPQEAAKIIIDVMQSKDRVHIDLIRNNIGTNQYYKLLWELEVYGTVCGKKVMNYTKFNKLPVTDIIRLYKYPNSYMRKRMDYLELSNLKRAGTILFNKLTRLATSTNI